MIELRRLARVLALVAAAASATGCGERELRNVVFILVDDLGWSDLGVYGSPFYETPNLDRLAAEGVRFSDAYAASPVCSPSRASLLTGKHPARLGFTDVLAPPHWTPRTTLISPGAIDALPQGELTLAEAFKEAGYATHFLGKWHLNFGLRDLRPYGLDSFFQLQGMKDLPDPPRAYRSDWYTDRAIELLEAERAGPLLLFLWYNAVHVPVEAKPELLAKYRAKARSRGLARGSERSAGGQPVRVIQSDPTYAGTVEGLDQSIGRLLDALVRLDLDRKTVVVVTSDNGGTSVGKWAVTSNAPLRAGKGWLYEGGIRVPLIIRWPGVTRPGSVCDEPVTGADLYPTLLELAGLPLRPDQHLDGSSLVPLLEADGELPRDALYWHYPHYGGYGEGPASAVRSGDYKLIEFFEGGGRVELYDLAEDPGEIHDLAALEPRRVAELRGKLRSWRRSVGAQLPVRDPYYDAGEPASELARRIVQRAPLARAIEGTAVAAPDGFGRTPLHFAAVSNHGAAVDFLIAAGADPNAADGDGRTPLHEAARRGHWQLAKMLLEHGASVDARDQGGSTPLHEAARWGHMRTVEILLENGADSSAADGSGAIPLQLAESHHWSELARRLREGAP